MGNPIAQFISDTVCELVNTSLVSISSEGDGEINQWIWNFGDNSAIFIDSDSLTSHVYSSSGSFYTTLNVIDEYNCTDQISDSVNIWNLPIVDFSF